MSRALLIELDDWAALYVEGQTTRFLVLQSHRVETYELAEALLKENVDSYAEVYLENDDPVFIYEFGDPMTTSRWRFPNDLNEKQFNYFWNKASVGVARSGS